MSLKNSVTPLGIDLETVRLIAQRLNHYAIPDPIKNIVFNVYVATISNLFLVFTKQRLIYLSDIGSS